MSKPEPWEEPDSSQATQELPRPGQGAHACHVFCPGGPEHIPAGQGAQARHVSCPGGPEHIPEWE